MEGNRSSDQLASEKKIRQKRIPKFSTNIRVCKKKKNNKMGGDKGKRKAAPGGAEGQKKKKKVFSPQ